MTAGARDGSSRGSIAPFEALSWRDSSTRSARPVRDPQGLVCRSQLRRRQRRTRRTTRDFPRVRGTKTARTCPPLVMIAEIERRRRGPEKQPAGTQVRASRDRGPKPTPAGAGDATSGSSVRWQSRTAGFRKLRALARASQVSAGVEAIEGVPGHRRHAAFTSGTSGVTSAEPDPGNAPRARRVRMARRQERQRRVERARHSGKRTPRGRPDRPSEAWFAP